MAYEITGKDNKYTKYIEAYIFAYLGPMMFQIVISYFFVFLATKLNRVASLVNFQYDLLY